MLTAGCLLGACLSNRNTLLGARLGITRTGS
jgi:hypothetical protein